MTIVPLAVSTEFGKTDATSPLLTLLNAGTRDLKSNTRHSNEPRGLVNSVGRLFASPWFSLVAAAIALLLTFSSVRNGLILDDYYHRAVLSGGELLRGPQAMMRFATGDPEHTRGWMNVGAWPWWTDPNFKLDFMHVIPTQTHILDYWLWPDGRN